nr:ORF3b [Mute swan feces associated gammacoronavirus]
MFYYILLFIFYLWCKTLLVISREVAYLVIIFVQFSLKCLDALYDRHLDQICTREW